MKKQQPSVPQLDTLKKSLLIVNVAFFTFTAFATIITYQFSDELSNQTLVNTVYSMMVISVIFFMFGFWLRGKASGNRSMGIFSGLYVIVISMMLFLTSNVMFQAGKKAGTIDENIHFFSFSLMQYLIMITILSVVMFFLTSAKFLHKEIQTSKVWASLLGLGIAIMAYIVMMFIKQSVFEYPETVKDAYDFLVGSVGFGSIGSAIIIVLLRSRK